MNTDKIELLSEGENKMKKILIITLLSALLFVLSGCGEEEETQNILFNENNLICDNFLIIEGDEFWECKNYDGETYNLLLYQRGKELNNEFAIKYYNETIEFIDILSEGYDYNNLETLNLEQQELGIEFMTLYESMKTLDLEFYSNDFIFEKTEAIKLAFYEYAASIMKSEDNE